MKYSHSGAKLSLHLFCDARCSAYACCLFLRTEYSNNMTCQLIQARNCVAPLKKMTIPRLQLLACTIGARLIQTVKKDLGLDEIIPLLCWSDSVNAFYRIKKNDNWGVFVFNRIQETGKLTNPDEWRHVAGPLNPADTPSRGCNAK
ncbi:uncharacterized protein [Parasteatoda tepidariorum]|uniref:uncharacterized protein n=1 Tax=Parasteatoda tepidariorum TaxID=114398 RepID=UPI0039BC3291